MEIIEIMQKNFKTSVTVDLQNLVLSRMIQVKLELGGHLKKTKAEQLRMLNSKVRVFRQKNSLKYY